LSTFLGYSAPELEKIGAILTASEIARQPALWHKTYQILEEISEDLKIFLDNIYDERDLNILLAGAGTSAFIGDVLQGPYQKYSGIPVRAVATTDIVTHPDLYFQSKRPTLLISFARSGNSPESVKTVQLANEICNNIYHLIITCNGQGELAKQAQGKNSFILLLPREADDQSLAMTGSFTSMLLIGILIARITELDKLKKQVQLMAQYGTVILEKRLNDLRKAASFNFNRAVFLGSGLFGGIARESHLKMQEMSDGRVICKHDSFLGFRHGPKAVITPQTLIVYLFSNNQYSFNYEKDLLQAVNSGERGMYNIGVMETNHTELDLDLVINLGDSDGDLDEEFFALVSVVPAQVLGFFKSIDLGLQPDNPSVSGTITRVVKGVKIYPYQII
jgi:tagatose-6-phosphate ketose/aldose isomerase